MSSHKIISRASWVTKDSMTMTVFHLSAHPGVVSGVWFGWKECPAVCVCSHSLLSGVTSYNDTPPTESPPSAGSGGCHSCHGSPSIGVSFQSHSCSISLQWVRGEGSHVCVCCSFALYQPPEVRLTLMNICIWWCYYDVMFKCRYSPYVIAMAHHVVAQWFVQCRIQYRPAIANFIYKVRWSTSSDSAVSGWDFNVTLDMNIDSDYFHRTVNK